MTNSLHSASSKVKCVTNKLLLRKTKIHPQNKMHFKLSGRTEHENGWFKLMTFSSFSSLGLYAFVRPWLRQQVWLSYGDFCLIYYNMRYAEGSAGHVKGFNCLKLSRLKLRLSES